MARKNAKSSNSGQTTTGSSITTSRKKKKSTSEDESPIRLSETSRKRVYEKEDDESTSNRLAFYAFVTALVSFVVYYGYIGYLETRIYTPLAEEKVVQKFGLQVPDRFWGSYRSGVYFGLKHRSHKSLTIGLMWILPSQVNPGSVGLRHNCDQNDGLKRYGWIEHDGTNFGVQEIIDNDIKITTSFVKRQGGTNGGDWTARVNVEPLSKSKDAKSVRDEVVLIFYVALEPGLMGSLDTEYSKDYLSALHGNTSELGSFIIRFLSGNGVLKASHLHTKVRSMNEISVAAASSLIAQRTDGKVVYALNGRRDENIEDSNLYMHQVHVKGPFTMEVVFETASFFNRPSMLAGDAYTEALQGHRDLFNAKFEETFHLAKKFDEGSIKFAQATFSNLIGGIGYFHGTSRVQSIHNKSPVPYWSSSLYSAVPSRSFFPRGFLWDEGFHLLLLNKWNPEIALDIISHWLDLMNTEGWIPREQILGDEALIRVPEEFVVQRNDVANPPTLIMALYDMLQRHREWLLSNHKSTLYRMWPRLTAWYHWLNKTQSGEIRSTYRWRGRNATIQRELNPKTLASGLDDYPRASHPTDSERHIDLRCWMAISSKLMGELSEMLGYDSSKYLATYNLLTDPDLLDDLHWSDVAKSYTDYGSHSTKVTLKYNTPEPKQRHHHHHQMPREKVRVTLIPPKDGYVNMFGYVSLFPMMLQILQPSSPKLLITLKNLDDPNLLWTPYGLRSLAANSALYNARNTEHDPPYWRGPIWININFLVLKALKYYSEQEGEVKSIALDKYQRLRDNVIRNIYLQYNKTGYVWEQYDDSTGGGKGCRPFTGWSSLVVLIMAEEY